MNFGNELESILGPSDILAFARDTLRFHPDEHQAKLLTTQARRVILNCTRQWGKSTAAAEYKWRRGCDGGLPLADARGSVGFAPPTGGA